jgi:AAA domain, putative AbiEii toxin, Type IV TA system
MHIRKIVVRQFRRFSDLEIDGIPSSTELVILAGPNGNGKSSLFDAFLNFADQNGGRANWDLSYHTKLGNTTSSNEQSRPNIEFHETIPTSIQAWRKTFYFRSAYRNDPDFKAGSISRLGSSIDERRFSRLIDNDATVNQNYQRLVGQGLEDIYERENPSTTIGAFRERTIGRIRDALAAVLPHLRLDSLGNPMDVGTFRFTKGVSHGYNYKNLSGGEKAIFDLILDLAVKRRDFDRTIFCIDEPEAHLNPRVHGATLDALLSLTSGAGQLWIATHSIGMMRRAVDLYHQCPGSVVFLDFDQDFDQPVKMLPTVPNRAFWQKTLEVALADMAALVAPSEIIACEGSAGDAVGDVADAAIYNAIFGNRKPESRFVAIGSNTNIEGDRFLVLQATAKTIPGCVVRRLIDRDEMTDVERGEKIAQGINVLSERHLESYLFDDELLQLLANEAGKADLFPMLQVAKANAIAKQSALGKPANHIKAASGQMRVDFVKVLGLTNAGKTTGAFMRDILAPLVRPGTNVYARLFADVFPIR